MVQNAVNPPFVVVAIMVAVPIAIARTCPVDETVAILLLVDDQDTVFMVALFGRTVDTNRNVVVRGSVNVVRLREIPDARVITRTKTDADLLPSWVDAVITVDPFPTAVIRPVSDTVAMDGCKDCQETALLVALEGRTVAAD